MAGGSVMKIESSAEIKMRYSSTTGQRRKLLHGFIVGYALGSTSDLGVKGNWLCIRTGRIWHSATPLFKLNPIKMMRYLMRQPESEERNLALGYLYLAAQRYGVTRDDIVD